LAIEVVIPMLGITIEKGTIVEWLKQEGDTVKKGEIIFVVETEKVTTEVESPASGKLAKILVPTGVEVPVLTPVAVITEPGEELPDKYLALPIRDSFTEPRVIVRDEKVPIQAPLQAKRGISNEPIRVMPAARKLAESEGLDLETVQGTGLEGMITIGDVEKALKDRKSSKIKVSRLGRWFAEKKGIHLEGINGTGVRDRIMRADVEKTIKEAATPSLGKVIPMNKMRQAIARRMTESAFTAPHIYFFTDIWMEPILDFCQGLLPNFERQFGMHLSINDLLVKAVALNILDFPILNATIKGQEIHVLPDVNIGLAVALTDGLIVPAIANADKVELIDIIRQRTDLVHRARIGKLSIEEIERGTFTVSSLSKYDITYFTAILNPPQSGILSIGKTRNELTMGDREIKEKKIATFGLSVDHRIIDGAVAGDFLQNLKWKLERPTSTFQ
jgi:pyruvate dehydrogenase E2 component (dihydrolipoamide acetyltransferase)